MTAGTASDRLRRVPVRALLSLALIVVAVRIVSARPLPHSFLGPDVVAAALFLYFPFFHYGRGRLPEWLRMKDPARSAATFLVLAAAGGAAYLLYASLPFGPRPPLRAGGLPSAGAFVLGQALLVALPEEVFFRGYLYDAFEERGLPPVVTTAVLFALSHLAIRPSPYRALTFFPAILFGWARRRSGNVYVPVLLHLAFNLLSWSIEVRG